MSETVSIERIERALLKVARLVESDPAFTPIFEALERDLAEAKSERLTATDAQERARRLLRNAA